jgi:hypothetical protein
LRRFRITAPLLALCAIPAGCSSGAGAPPKSAADVYQAARDTSDTLAVSLDALALAHRARVRALRDAAAATCQGPESDPVAQACRAEKAQAEVAKGRAVATAIDAAADGQRIVATALTDYAACAPGLGGDPCRAVAIGRAIAKTPTVLKAVQAAREAVKPHEDPVAH